MARLTERLADLASGVFLNTARVTGVSRLSARFVQIDLQAEAFRSAAWTPGAKLQIRPRQGSLSLRTYTPITWDPAEGTTRLIAFTHGTGPAAEWFRAIAVGDTCEFFGPRGSIDLRALSGTVVFVGDETSLGLAYALRSLNREVRHVIESTDPAELTALLPELGFDGTVSVVPKSADRVALLEKARDAARSAAGPFDLVLTGDAATVHAVRRDARQWPHPASTTKGKAYWAVGRTGLD